MIIDSHVYSFPPVDSARGHASGEEHLRWVQAAHARHHQPAWRIRDRAPASSEVLAPQSARQLDALPDVRFRINKPRGRVVWNVGDEEYTKYFFPPNLRDGEYTPYSLTCEMDYADVDVGLIHTDPMLVRDSSYLAECVQRFPDRLRAMAPVDEWRIRDDAASVIREMTAAITNDGLHAIKFNPTGYMTSPEPWDDGSYRPFWEAATSLGVPIFFTLGTGPELEMGSPSLEAQRKGYLNELALLVRWMERYPGSTASITHGFPWRLFVDGDRIVLPDAVWAPFENPNLSLEVCFPVRLGDLFDFPYREVWPTLQEMVERVGSGRLLWGTDMPFQNRFCTYRQSRDWIEKYCDFLTPDDVANIMGGAAARVLGI